MKNEHAAAEQSGQGNRHPYPLVGYEDYDYDDYPVIINEADGEYDDDYGFGYWADDGYFLEYDYEYEAETYYDPEGDVYYEEGQDGEWYEMDCDHSAEDWSDTYKASKGKKGKGKGHDSKGKGSSSSGGTPSKGGGKQPHGKQCTECGSKFHDSAHCPMQALAVNPHHPCCSRPFNSRLHPLPRIHNRRDLAAAAHLEGVLQW